MKLLEITRIMQQLDNELCELGESEVSEIIGEILPEKVDNLYSVLSSYQAEIERIAAIITEFQQTKRSLQSGMDRLKEYIVYSMESTGAKKLPGDRYTLSLVARESYEWDDRELFTDDFITLNQAMPGMVKRAFALDKTVAKEFAKANPTSNLLWKKVTKPFVQFRVKKGV